MLSGYMPTNAGTRERGGPEQEMSYDLDFAPKVLHPKAQGHAAHPGGPVRNRILRQRRCIGLIPDVTLAPFHVAFGQQSAKLLLKRRTLVVLFLRREVRAHGLHMSRADREHAIAVLLMEIVERGDFRFHPLGGFAFELLNQVGNRDRSAKTAEQMNVVSDAADAKDRATDVVADPAEIIVHLVADGRVLKEWPPLFGREYDVQIDLREGLRQGAPA